MTNPLKRSAPQMGRSLSAVLCTATALAVLTLGLGGCAKKKECDALAKVMKEEREAFGDKEEDFTKMSKNYAKARDAVDAVAVTVPELKAKKDAYVEHLDHMAKAAELTAKMQAGEATKADAKAALDKVKGESEMELYISTLKVCSD